MKPQSILFFADRLPPLIGGMEMHARYFIEHFSNHPRFPICKVITKNAEGQNGYILNQKINPIDLKDLPNLSSPAFIFFNSGRWIEELEYIRTVFPNASFLYRTGGNEILKAPLLHQEIPEHLLRQAYWVKTLNNFIDILITNSAYTEKRLRDTGIKCPFLRCVGGVNTSALKISGLSNISQDLTIFCAARFVPYKNHSLLLSIIHSLIQRGHQLRLRLAGEGPLLSEIKTLAINYNLTPIVEFLGVLDNEEACREIAQANIYMQLSSDYISKVSGGSYIHSECMGRSILEALTAGTFVIAGRSGALSEIVTEDRGLLLDLNNQEQIVLQIEHILKNLPGHLPFIDTFSWDNIFKRYEEKLEDFHENIAYYRKM